MPTVIQVEGEYALGDSRNITALPLDGGGFGLVTIPYVKDGSIYIPQTTAMTSAAATPTGFAASGHGTQALSTTGAALPSVAGKIIVIENPATNTINVLWGNSVAQNHILVPGEKLSLPISNLAAIFMKSASGTPSIVYSVLN